jgi:acyl-CoA hydrolase
MVSDGVVKAIERGIITNQKKTLHPGKVVATFILGSEQLYEYVDNNPYFELHPCDYTNNPFVIAQNAKMVAINSAIEVDLTGQVCADSIGTKIYSGFGGQVDFIRGAAYSKDGKPIIALPSTTKNDTISRIVPTLKHGAGVVTTRADVHYVVTEYGIASLHGKNLQQRAEALIAIAHPHFRDELERSLRKGEASPARVASVG